jgi:hypothetical protein
MLKLMLPRNQPLERLALLREKRTSPFASGKFQETPGELRRQVLADIGD